MVGISAGMCHGILLDVLNVRHVYEHVVPRNISYLVPIDVTMQSRYNTGFQQYLNSLSTT